MCRTDQECQNIPTPKTNVKQSGNAIEKGFLFTLFFKIFSATQGLSTRPVSKAIKRRQVEANIEAAMLPFLISSTKSILVKRYLSIRVKAMIPTVREEMV